MAPASLSQARVQPGFELRFQSLFNAGRGLAFPCDAEGHVDLDGLSDMARKTICSPAR